jgi:hypothetical protein
MSRTAPVLCALAEVNVNAAAMSGNASALIEWLLSVR